MRHLAVCAWMLALAPTPLAAVQEGALLGTVRDQEGTPLARVALRLRGTAHTATSDAAGRFALDPAPPGAWILEVRALGWAPIDRPVRIAAGEHLVILIRLERRVFDLGAIVVEGATRGPEQVLETPVAVAVAPRDALRAATLSGEAPHALRQVPGVDVVQSDLFDYNINARGFNGTLNRSVLVLVDGRDIAVPFLGSQEWAAISFAPEDLAQVEFVRGPGSALYGANAFNGVVNITTPDAREALGTRVTVGGGTRATLRADLRHGAQLARGRVAYRVSGGYQRGVGYAVSRTRRDAADFAAEYGAVTDDSVVPPPPGFEQAPVNGQVVDPATGAAAGDPLPVINYYGAGRLDWQAAGGTVTLDGGAARVANEVFMTGIGRFQVDAAVRPWGRVRYASPGLVASAWYSGRTALAPQRLLTGNQPVDDHSAIWQAEAQVTRAPAPSLALVLGASARLQQVDTRATLMDPATDDRRDKYFAVFGQADWRMPGGVRLVFATRVDAGDLFDPQVSPRAALIWRLAADHAVRLTVSRAFLTPSQIEYFLAADASVQDLTPLEDSLRTSPIGNALQAVPQGTLFTQSGAVPVLVRGNANLRPERVVSVELGYKGRPAAPLFVTADVFFSRRTDFITSLLPATAVNADYPAWTAPDDVPPALRGVVEGTVRGVLAGTLAQYGLTRLPDGRTAIVLSYGNAGLVEDYGVELGAGLWLDERLRFDASATWYRFDVRQEATGDTLVANTPELKGTFGMLWEAPHGLELGLAVRGQTAFLWRSGLYRGRVPAYRTVDLQASWQATPLLRLHGIAMNLFDRRHFEAYGGAVTGRRVLGGVTATF